LLKPHHLSGGNITLNAYCASCDNDTATAITDLTYGDVWFCSGQSNMELTMQFALTRNRTFAALAKGQYQNIRTLKHRHGGAPGGARWDGDEQWTMPQPDPSPQGNDNTQADGSWQHAHNASVEQFSAACWFFAQELTDMALTENASVPILGLVESAWCDLNHFLHTLCTPFAHFYRQSLRILAHLLLTFAVILLKFCSQGRL